MRQTSRAVALLLALESAQASLTDVALNYANQGSSSTEFQDYAAAWNLANPAYATNNKVPSNLSNRQGAYQTELPTDWTWTTVIQKAYTVASQYSSSTDTKTDLALSGLVKVVPGSGCMACLGSSMTNVWCSRTYSFLITNSNNMYQHEYLEGAQSMGTQVPGKDDDAISGSFDGGSCCDTNVAFLKQTGQIKEAMAPTGSWDWTAGNATTGTSGVIGWAATCVAITNTFAAGASPNTTDLVVGQGVFEAGFVPWSSWWCSNGLYKNVTGSGAATINKNQTFLSASNQRRELARVGCPQKKLFCGGVAGIYTAGLTSSTTEIKMPKTSTITKTTGNTSTYPTTGATMNVQTLREKCTWAAGSYAWAPTFKLTNGDSGEPGITSNVWQIHTMEYTTGAWSPDLGALQEITTTDGYVTATSATSLKTYLPHFAMPGAQFATLRTWYGDGGASTSSPVTVLNGYPASWYAPGRAGDNGLPFTAKAAAAAAEVAGQQFGNVAHMPASTSFTATSSATAVPAASSATVSQGNYGELYQVTSANGNARFDLRVVRYMPAQVAQSVWAAGDALLKQYDSEKSSYDTAKTTWDAYVAILTKNAKMDAFAAAFSPPKAPTVPPLPNKPWAPAAYSGFVAQTAAGKALMKANSAGTTALLKDAQPTAQQFWTSLAAAQTIGGWGAWTATILTYREGWGKSFGTIGYSGQATASGLSVVWNPKWACGSSSIATAATATTACQKVYTALGTDTFSTIEASGKSASFTNASGTAGSARLVVVVSLWSLGNTKTVSGVVNVADDVWTGKQSLQLTWTGAPWSAALATLSAIAAPTAAADAASLSGIAGAQALAASTAAALAAAAALY